MTGPTDEAMRVSKEFIDALSRRDGEALSALLHDNVVLESPYPVAPGENVPGSARCEGVSVHNHVRNMANVLSSLTFENAVWRATSDGLAMFQADGRATLPNGTPTTTTT